MRNNTYFFITVAGVALYTLFGASLVHAQVFKSQQVGIQVGDGSIAATLPGDNLIYGVLGPSLEGSLLLLQNGSANTKFQVDKDGNVTATGAIYANQICIQAVCQSSWPTIAESDTLQTVTDRDAITTKGITVDTIDTGHGATNVYLMNQPVRTSDSVTFAVVTATGGNSASWNAAYTDRLKWNGGATNLDPVAGRASLGLGDIARFSAAGTATITPDIVSSLDGVVNDGGNIDIVQGSGVIISSSDINNTVTITATGGASGWVDDGAIVRLTASSDKVGIGNNNPEVSLHVGVSSNPTWRGVRMTVVDNSALSAADSAAAYIESSGNHSGARATALKLTAIGRLSGANSSVLSMHAESAGSTLGDGLRVVSKDPDVSFLSAKDSTGTEVMALKYDGGAYFGGGVMIKKSSTAYNLEVNGTIQADKVILGTYAGNKPTCNSSVRGSLVFDTSADRSYFCNGTAWKALD